LCFSYMAVATSMRTSELFGLRWSDVAFDRGFIRVSQQLARTEDGVGFGSPKSAAGKRRIDLPAALVKLLRDHRKTQGDNPRNLVFPNEAGGFISKDNFRKRVWSPLLTKAKLPYATFYSLRHAGNSLLVSNGYSMKLAQSRLGQSDPKVALGTFAFLGENEGRNGADLLGKLPRGTFGGTKAKSDAS
jgi:integrase